MHTTPQAKIIEEVKIRLLRRKMTITELASRLRPKRHRNTVSQAIHHPDYFPRVHTQVKEFLNIS